MFVNHFFQTKRFYKSAAKMNRLRSKKLIGLAISFPPLVVIEASVVVVVFKVIVAFGCKVV